MSQGTKCDEELEARGLLFPRAAEALPAEALAELQDGAPEEALSKAALSVARPRDRALVLGVRSGLLPAMLAGRLGLRHVTVVEPDPELRHYFAGVLEANALIRVDLRKTLPETIGADAVTFLVTDLSGTCPDLPESLALDGLRGAVLRLPTARQPITSLFSKLSNNGLTYFPRQSAGDVVTFLSRWN